MQHSLEVVLVVGLLVLAVARVLRDERVLRVRRRAIVPGALVWTAADTGAGAVETVGPYTVEQMHPGAGSLTGVRGGRRYHLSERLIVRVEHPDGIARAEFAPPA